jgi:GNAT superfamily N-acetyltransferase
MPEVKIAIKVEAYSREWLDKNKYELTDELFRKFDLLNERDWSNAEEVAIAYSEEEIVGVIIGYFNTCLICQVSEQYRRQGIGTELVKASGLLFPKQNGAPEFWEAMANV